MTLAAGMWFDDGVLLFAESRYTSDAMVHQSKIFHAEYEGGRTIFALAGNEGYAKLAIQEAAEAIRNCEPKHRTLGHIRKLVGEVVKRVQVEHIDTRPAHEHYDSQIHILAAVWSAAEGLRLFASRRTAMIRIDGLECAGSGSYLGRYVIDPAYKPTLKRKEALLLASQSLSAAKEYDPGCGGKSEIWSISKTGEVTRLLPFDSEHAEDIIRDFRSQTQDLLFAVADAETTEAEFNSRLSAFLFGLPYLRSRWRYVARNPYEPWREEKSGESEDGEES